jgi:hypothetical protein
MNEDFVSFELAKKLKEKGFDCNEPFAMYNELGIFHPLYTSCDETLESCIFGNRGYYDYDDFDEYDCVCPTISQVLKWLRDSNAIHIHICLYSKRWYCDVYTYEYYEEDREYGAKHNVQLDEFSTYEEAAIAGIEYVIDNLI